MHWPIFGIALFVTAILQITSGRYFPLAEQLVRPDFLALLALFLTLYTPRRYAPLAAWIVGFMADLLSVGVFGTFSFSFGLLGLLTLSARQLLHPDHPVSRIILAFCWTFLAHSFSFALPWIFGWRSFGEFSALLGLAFCIALYTAAFTPVYYLLAYGKRWLRVPASNKIL